MFFSRKSSHLTLASLDARVRRLEALAALGDRGELPDPGTDLARRGDVEGALASLARSAGLTVPGTPSA